MMTDVLSSYFMQDAHVAYKKAHQKSSSSVGIIFRRRKNVTKKTTSSLAAVVHLSFSMEFF